MLWILFLLGLYCTLFPPQVHEPLNSYSNIMLAVPRNTGDNFSISHTPPGRYSLLAFDLENNCLPRMRLSLAYISEILEVRTSRGGTAAPLPSSVGITAVKLLHGDVEVTCSIPETSCLVLVHSINSPEQVFVRLFNSADVRTVVFSVDLIGTICVSVLTWAKNDSIFDSQLSFVTQLETPTAVPTTTIPATTSNLQTNPPPEIESRHPLSTAVIAGVSMVVMILLLFVVTTVAVVGALSKRRHHEVEVPESDGRVDWSSTFAGIEQPNEAYASVLKNNIAYGQIKKPQGQRIDDSQAPATLEGEYEIIEPVHVYEDVLPQGKASRANYVNIN